MGRGVPQGSILSPIVFIIYLNSLLTELGELGGVVPIGYADDVAIVTDSNCLPRVWECINSWARKRFMTVGIKDDGTKTAILIKRPTVSNLGYEDKDLTVINYNQ
jgi:hypothetical protein